MDQTLTQRRRRIAADTQSLVRQMFEQLEQYRETRTRLLAERDSLKRVAMSREEVVQTVDAYVDHCMTEGKKHRTRLLLQLASGTAPGRFFNSDCRALLRANGEAKVAAGTRVLPVQVDLGEVLVAIAGPDRARAVILEGIDDVPVGVDAAAKAARLAEIETAVLQVEVLEEDLIVELETMGKKVSRRADADPEVVLGLKGKKGVQA